jgi:gas vesicle protein
VFHSNLWIEKACENACALQAISNATSITRERKLAMKTDNGLIEHEPMRAGSTVRPVLAGMLVGSAMGAATMLLFAPRSGEDTRAEIRGKAIELCDDTTVVVKDTVSRARTRTAELKGYARDMAEEKPRRGDEIVLEKAGAVFGLKEYDDFLRELSNKTYPIG